MLVLLCGAVSADDGGWYVFYGGGSTHLPLKVNPPAGWDQYGFYTSVEDNSRSYVGALGYRTAYVNIELSYHDLGGYSACLRNVYLSPDLVCGYASARTFSLGLNHNVLGPIFVGAELHSATAKGSLVTRIDTMHGTIPTAYAGLRFQLGKNVNLRLQANSKPIAGFSLGMEQTLR